MRCPKIAISTILVSITLSACGYDNGSREHVDAELATVDPIHASIDTDARMANLESGVGLFVEYVAGGTWRIQTACDTAVTKKDCLWDLQVYTKEGSHIRSFSAINLERSDYASIDTDGIVQLLFTTTSDLDGVELAADPGETLTVDAVLEGEPNPNRYIYWMSNGEVVEGADSPVVEFTPTLP